YSQHVSTPPSLMALGAIAVVLVAILTFVEKARKLVGDVYRWVFRLIAPKENPHRVDLRITPERTGFCNWQEGSVAGKPSMIVRCVLHVSNVGPCPAFQILDSYIRKPKTQGFPLPGMSR